MSVLLEYGILAFMLVRFAMWRRRWIMIYCSWGIVVWVLLLFFIDMRFFRLMLLDTMFWQYRIMVELVKAYVSQLPWLKFNTSRPHNLVLISVCFFSFYFTFFLVYYSIPLFDMIRWMVVLVEVYVSQFPWLEFNIYKIHNFIFLEVFTTFCLFFAIPFNQINCNFVWVCSI